MNKLLRKLLLNFQNMNIMLLNDLRLFFRDKKSLILVLLTPFLILSVLINLYNFTDVTENLRGVELGICDEDNSDFHLESEMFHVSLFTNNCEELVLSKVRHGELRGAIIIPQGFKSNIETGDGSQLKLYIDNSKTTTAVVTSNAVQAYAEQINKEIGTKFILEAWTQLSELNTNLRFLVDNLNMAIPVAQDLRHRMNILDNEINTIDFDSHRETVQNIHSFLNLLSIQLDYIDTDMITSEHIKLVPEINITSTTQLLIDDYNLNSNFWKTSFCPNNSIILINPICNVINYTDAIILNMRSDAQNLSEYSNNLTSKINEINTQINNINYALDKLHELSDSSSETNQKLKSDLQKLDTALILYEDKTQNISATMNDLTKSVDDFLSDVVRVRDELNNTIVILDEYTKKEPSSILRPVTVFTQGVFADKKEIFYKLPALMSILLMFITLLISSSLIVNERKGGTMARIFLSPLSTFFYVYEKITYLLLLCVAAIISMFIAGLIFGAILPINFSVILILFIASLVYISLGTLIGALSKSENTALLTCLVISFPLMFMSGTFSPPELMDKFIRVVAHYLPLTLNVNLLESITIYNTNMNPTNLVIMLMMITTFYVGTVLLIKNKPTLK